MARADSVWILPWTCSVGEGACWLHPLRSSQPRLLPHLHHRTQFQALPNSRIPTHPAVLVLRSRFICGLASVDSAGGGSGCGRSGVFEKGLTESGSQFAVYLLCPFYCSFL